MSRFLFSRNIFTESLTQVFNCLLIRALNFNKINIKRQVFKNNYILLYQKLNKTTKKNRLKCTT